MSIEALSFIGCMSCMCIFIGRSGAALEVCIFLQERFDQIASSCSSLALVHGVVKLSLELGTEHENRQWKQ